MSINHINHWALTAANSVHDEESLTALQLQARMAAKVNECVSVINEQINIINAELDKLEGYAVDAVEDSIKDGRISTALTELMWENLKTTYAQLDARINNLVLNATPAGSDNAEIVDARNGYGQTFETLGSHIRALGNGSAFADAVRPGTVRAGRITAGMTGGELRDKYTIREVVPMAGHWNGSDGYHDMTTLDFVAHTGYKMSDLIPCEYGDAFVLTSYIYGNQVKPAALFNSDKQCVGVAGKVGEGNWDPIADEVHVGRSDVAYIAFICGSGQVSDFRAMRVSIKDAPDRDVYGSGKGYIHARAKKRTDTITDRAQVKCWFKLPEDRSEDDFYAIPLQLLRYTNLDSWTFRLFAAGSDSSYEMQLPTSAAGYKFATSQGIRPTFTVPLTTSEGVPVTHVCLFVDLLPAREDDYINAYMTPVSMLTPSGSVKATGYTLHGNLTTDTLNVVWPGAASSPLFEKRILGIGDSLMSGNTLAKSKSWFNLAAGARDMVHHNAAVNGRPVAGADSMRENLSAMLTAFPNPDYVIIQGGANDLRTNVSIDTFKTDLTAIVETIRQSYPECKILLASNWSRSQYINNSGYVESDYVDAMLEVGENLRVPVVNNWTTGLDLRNPSVAAWADEGLVTNGTANIHFSEAANEYIATAYINALEAL